MNEAKVSKETMETALKKAPSRPRTGKSRVWHYFEETAEMKAKKCNLCGNIIMASGGNTSNMRSHLKHKHPEALEDCDTYVPEEV